MLALGATAAIAGPMIYRDLIAGPAVDAPTLTADETITGDSPSGPLDPADFVGEWSIASGSEAGYRVDEVLNGTDVTVTGRTDDVRGGFTVGESGLVLESANVAVDVASITTDSANRDEYFRGEALRASEFPEATFVLTEPAALDSAPRAGDVVRLDAVGELTIAGETREVTADVELKSDGETLEIAGSVPIEFADFGVEAPSLGFVTVEPEGAVEFQLLAERS